MLDDSSNKNLLQEEEEEDILTFENEPEESVKEEPKQEKPQVVEEVEKTEPNPLDNPPENEIAMAYDFTIPKQKLLDPERFPHHKKMIEPITQDIATSHLSDKGSTVVHDNYRLILNILALSNLTGRHLIEAERFHVGKIATFANVSKGELGNLIKILRSNYNITEQKSEERISADEKIYQQTKENRGLFDIPQQR